MAPDGDETVWSEEEYVTYLRGERRRFAWVMRRYGGLSPSEAEAAALNRYPYEPSDEAYRGLIFHDEAWHWAMLELYGDSYWIDRPELTHPSPEYRALD
ncbi:hypothetical protein [Nonomuraea candida]|uniref:hypothetical protein n=1 Tax=Nonomuraea candida TaxID=359159 RepID=UPI000A05BB69|nr:hypothetical protein [Nonomuraea candida]